MFETEADERSCSDGHSEEVDIGACKHFTVITLIKVIDMNRILSEDVILAT